MRGKKKVKRTCKLSNTAEQEIGKEIVQGGGTAHNET